MPVPVPVPAHSTRTDGCSICRQREGRRVAGHGEYGIARDSALTAPDDVIQAYASSPARFEAGWLDVEATITGARPAACV